jgi:hypothetical protein
MVHARFVVFGVAAGCGTPVQTGPDLVLLGDQMANTLSITTAAFDPTACEVIEGCVGGPGLRELLRFDTVTANVGAEDLVMGPRPAIGKDNDEYLWSPCHSHHHVRGYATYNLLDGGGVIVGGHKQAFCLQDVQQLDPERPGRGFTCDRQGMSAGWGDVYSADLPCQWIDITGVPAGSYTLEVRINPDGQLPDLDHDNNVWSIAVPGR